MKLLITAFKGKNNTSFQLASKIGKDTIFLTNSFQGLEKNISSAELNYDAIIMLGSDKNLNNSIRIETCAKYDSEVVYTGFCTDLLVRRFCEGSVAYSFSEKPTEYLCNAAYYQMLKRNPNTVFIHIPSSKGMSEQLLGALANAIGFLADA